MSKTIYKYAVPVAGEIHSFDLPRPAEIIRVASQHDFPGTVFFWAVVDPAVTDTRRRHFTVVGTGHIWPVVSARYIGSAEVANGVLVWHLLELDS